MFDAIDADGDGTITTRELRRAVVALKKLDADGDGNLTRDEALAPPPMGGMPSRDPGRGGPDAEVEAMMRHDRNGDGRLTEDEVPPQLAQQLAGADANGDGAIDRIELQAALSNPQRGGDPRQGPDMMQYDRNRDGQLSPDEVPTNLRGMLRGSDADANGKIDANELQSIQQRLNERARGGRRLPPGMEIGPGGLQRNGE
jgi:Ca2+-binding EF-hand superfamily protein